MNKTVYILGAGFSKDSGAPLQHEIINAIMTQNPDDLDIRYQDYFRSNRESFRNFLEHTLYIEPTLFKDVVLEDIFTPLDRCILDNISFRNIPPDELVKIRQTVIALIAIQFDHLLRGTRGEYVNRFAEHLVALRNRFKSNDPFSIISTNWDILLDNAVFEKIPASDGVVDYCCYIAPYNPNDKLLPGLLALGKGKYNVKILKLHGSMNWLRCQRCQRLFVTFFEKIALDEFLQHPRCRLCEKNYARNSGHDGGGLLVSDLIMPTFLKDLDNVQIKLVWQNAGVELSEANKIVFLGYSFPAADFDVRQLLSRFVRHTAQIDVVLYHNDNPANAGTKYEDLPEFRFKSFFGKRQIVFSYEGVAQYISTTVANTAANRRNHDAPFVDRRS